jgi:hypothetical protein
LLDDFRAMNQISAETQLAMPRAEAWAKLRDLTLAQYYVPGVMRIEITTTQREGVGASRRAYCKGRPPVDETVILWEDGWGYTIKLHNGHKPPTPFKQAQFTYWLDDAPGGETRMRATMSYEPPFGILGRLMNALLLRHLLPATLNSIGRGLKQVYETGASANPLVEDSRPGAGPFPGNRDE